MDRARIAVVEDDADHLASVCDLIEVAGHIALPYGDAETALEVLPTDPPDMILSDLCLPRIDGITLLERLGGAGFGVPVVMLTGHGDVERAVRAMRLGAEDFIEKPYDAEHLLSVIERTLRARRLTAEIARLQIELSHWRANGFVGQSRAITQLRATLERLAPLQIDVLLGGETGTGKELAARILHRHGSLAAGPFVAIDCGALLEAEADAELFGRAARLHGLAEDIPGRIEAANGGTLFLDRIDAMPMTLQAKLLRLLETRQIDRGAGRVSQLEFRVIAASTVSLREAIIDNRFREDLYFRLAGYEIALPPLRTIPTDIPILFSHFATEAAARHGRERPDLSYLDRQALEAHHWPGNARELRTVAERHVLGLAQLRHVEPGSCDTAVRSTLKDLVQNYEAQEIARVLDRCRGNTALAAKLLGIPRRTLNAKISRTPWLRK